MWAVARWKVCGQEPGSWGGSGGAEPLLACDLDEKDEAGRAEADEVGEEAGYTSTIPATNIDPLGGRGFGEQPPCMLEARQTTPSTAVNTAQDGGQSP